MRIVFLDLETTGLDPDRHEPWEIGLIARGHYANDREFLWRVMPDLTKADPNSLRIGRYYERTAGHLAPTLTAANLASPDAKPKWSLPGAVAPILAGLLDGAHIVACNPSFDAAFLKRFLPEHGHAFTAHYHLIDIGSMVAGWAHGVARQAADELSRRDLPHDTITEIPALVTSPPWDSDTLSRAVGVDPEAFERHTALGDARWVRAQWDAITGGSDSAWT